MELIGGYKALAIVSMVDALPFYSLLSNHALRCGKIPETLCFTAFNSFKSRHKNFIH